MPCPVRGCQTRVPLQRRTFRRSPEFRCPLHRVYIGPSTFEYESETDNLVSQPLEDQEFLAAIRRVKREGRMGRERSEDALTWNVFRHLETSGRLGPWLRALAVGNATTASVHYWSCEASSDTAWAPLVEARSAFDEREGRGSEPDLVIATEDTYIWVEAKLGSTNDTRPSDVEAARGRYTGGAGGWYSSVVSSQFAAVAVELRRYELLRLWLLGSWSAAQRGKRFMLLNLVREGFETDVLELAQTHFRQGPDRLVRQVTWESICRAIEAASPHSTADEALLHYMRGKTLGYDGGGRLLRAFALE